ncbi:tRNA lysidine(34) synthetase TilS [Lacticaseibacillus zhaodongensis]|uniref:tRNA lysidine(34) synthetase TilS n=1 Tax=Lacticaseibacillus zhaodongensis TaxID=2668065 RepID=UPI0012D365ED|nr:tRNA lysidine(34) synthetase TilS [Lacticaseibacillus zhaodongensis]
MLTPNELAHNLEELQVAPGSTILVAVSGGADSLTLLDLLVRLRPRLQLTVGAVHINHELRPESVAEEQKVRAYCTAHAVPLTCTHWPVAQHPASGIEAAARKFRYASFAAAARAGHYQVLMTAHHRDDQVETVLFRLLRSGDVHSVAGIRPRRDWQGIVLVRPLLNYSRQEIRAYATMRHLPFSDDASNADTHYSRNFIRHEVLPQLRARMGRVDEHIARFARDQQGVLELADMTVCHYLGLLGPKTDEFSWKQLQNEERSLQLQVLTAAMRRCVPDVSAKQLAEILAALNRHDGETRRVELARGQIVVVRAQQLRVQQVAAATVATPATQVLTQLDQAVPYRGGQLLVTRHLQPGDEILGSVAGDFPFSLRTRQPGDYLTLANGQHQKLRRFFINEHVNAADRAQLLLLVHGSEVVWIENLALNQLFKPQSTVRIKANLVLRRA